MQNLIYIYTFYICIHILYTYTIYLDVHILFIYIHSTFADYLLFSFFLFCFFFFTIYLYYLFTHHCYLLPAYQCILVNQQLLINLVYYNFKSIFSLLYNFYLLLLLIVLCSPLFLFHYCSFEYISEVLTCPKDIRDTLIQGWHLIVWYFPFHGLHFVTTLRVLKPVLCFHMASFNYGAKGVRDVDPTCRCHQSNIIPDSIFSVNIAHCVIYD